MKSGDLPDLFFFDFFNSSLSLLLIVYSNLIIFHFSCSQLNILNRSMVLVMK
jgi:hypothetical protein